MNVYYSNWYCTFSKSNNTNDVLLMFEPLCTLIHIWMRSQSNEPMVMKDSRIVVFLWSFSFFHKKDFWDEIFYNMLLKIHIIFSIHHIFRISFSWITKIFFKCTDSTKFFILFWEIILGFKLYENMLII